VSNRHKVEDKGDYKDSKNSNYKADLNGANKTTYKIGSSGMFALNARPDIADIEKL